MIDNNQMYKQKEVLKLLSITQTTLDEMSIRGDLERVNINPGGGKPSYRITGASLAKLIQDGSN